MKRFDLFLYCYSKEVGVGVLMTKGLHFQLLKFVLYMCSMLFLFCFPVNPHVGYKNQTMDNEVKHFCGCAVAERAVWTCSPPKVSSGHASDSARGHPGACR